MKNIYFVPTRIDPKYEIIGEGEDKKFILKIFDRIQGTNIGQIFLNYSWTADKDFKNIY